MSTGHAGGSAGAARRPAHSVRARRDTQREVGPDCAFRFADAAQLDVRNCREALVYLLGRGGWGEPTGLLLVPA